MNYCQKCGNKNDEDAEYCNKCGNYLNKPSSFEKNIEEAAEELGRKAEAFGKRFIMVSIFEIIGLSILLYLSSE